MYLTCSPPATGPLGLGARYHRYLRPLLESLGGSRAFFPGARGHAASRIARVLESRTYVLNFGRLLWAMLLIKRHVLRLCRGVNGDSRAAIPSGGGSFLLSTPWRGAKVGCPKLSWFLGQMLCSAFRTVHTPPPIPLASISALATSEAPQGNDRLPMVSERLSSKTYSTVPSSMAIP